LSSELVSSERITVSTPDGNIAPVNIFMAEPNLTLPSYGSPAAAIPIVRGKICGPDLIHECANPKPSTAELDLGGLDLVAVGDIAKILPAATFVGIFSISVIRWRDFLSLSSASSTGIQVTPRGRAKQSLVSFGGLSDKCPTTSLLQI